MIMNEFAPLTVEPALASVDPASTATPMNTLVSLRPVLRWGGMGLVLLGIVLAILRRQPAAHLPIQAGYHEKQCMARLDGDGLGHCIPAALAHPRR